MGLLKSDRHLQKRLQGDDENCNALIPIQHRYLNLCLPKENKSDERHFFSNWQKILGEKQKSNTFNSFRALLKSLFFPQNVIYLNYFSCLYMFYQQEESVVGSLIEATGMIEFEDGL